MSLLAACLAGAGCSSVECGDGTIEQDGVCIAGVDPGTQCGPGTTYSSITGRCEGNLTCGPNTELVTDQSGNMICRGIGGSSSDCGTPLPCPASTMPNTVSLCGRIFDLEDSTPLDDGIAENGEPWKTVELRVLDPFAFIGDPNAPASAKSTPDSCGRFAIANAPRPGHGFIALSVEDIVMAGTSTPQFGDNMVQAGIAAAVDSGQILANLRLWTFRRTTDEMWSAAAGFASGQTFGKMGVYIPIFLTPGSAGGPFPASAPTAGVTTAILDLAGVRTVQADKDFYFDDTNPLQRKVLNKNKTSTGANGTSLYIMQPGLGTFSGIGANPTGTCWEKTQAAAPGGGAFIQERSSDIASCP